MTAHLQTSYQSDSIQAGAASRVINPPVGLPLLGYPGSAGRLNQGVSLDLCVRAAVFSTADAATAVVAIDTLGVDPPLVKRIRQAAARRVDALPAEAILVAATHTHSAPALQPFHVESGPITPDPAYVDQVVEQSADAVAAAWRNRSAVRARLARTDVKLGHNRRVVDSQGQATNVWEDPEGLHTGFFNPAVRILVLEEVETRRPTVLLSLYGVHPVCIGGKHPMANPDYPGYFARAVEAALPGCCAIHLTGGAGAINPRRRIIDDPSRAKAVGEFLARAVLDELPYARPVNAAPIGLAGETLHVPLGPDAPRNYTGRHRDSLDGRTLAADVQVLRLGEIALVSTPGELFGETAMAIENTSPFGTTFVIGYANDNLGYLAPEAVLREGGYESLSVMSPSMESHLLAAARTALTRATTLR